MYEQDLCIPGPQAPATPIVQMRAYAQVVYDFAYPGPSVELDICLHGARMAKGQKISHPNFGTLTIIEVYDECQGRYRIENQDLSQESEDLEGKPVRAGEKFYLGEPCDACETSASGDCVELLADFYIPDVGLTSPCVVSTFSGFSIGIKVLLRNVANPTIAYTYVLSSFSGSNTLVLQNDGQGGTPGDVLYADANNDGISDWCVEPLENLSVCERATETTILKYVVGCDGEGNEVKIEGNTENEALVYDADQEGYINKVLPAATVCVTLDTCFQISPQGEVYLQPTITITTDDDVTLLAEAADALLTDNSLPIILICDYLFMIDLGASVPGAIVIQPLFDPVAVVSFDENCRVCIPDDCCSQCSPQVQFPVEELEPIGYTDTVGITLPTDIFNSGGAGEYLFSVVKDQGNTYPIVFAHDSAGTVYAAYNGATGASIALGSLPGVIPDDYHYYFTEYYKDTPCLEEVIVEEDAAISFSDIPDTFSVHVNHYCFLSKFDYTDLVTPLETTQYQLMADFVGPSINTSAIDPWLGVVPVKGYQNQTAFNKRSFILEFGQVLQVRTVTYVTIYVVTPPAAGSFIYGNLTSTIMMRSHVY